MWHDDGIARDARTVFRQLPVDPAGAPAFGYVVGDSSVTADLRLHFGWRDSPRWWGLAASVIEHVRRQTTQDSAAHAFRSTSRSICKDSPANREGNCTTSVAAWRSTGGSGIQDSAFVCVFVDGAICVEVQREDKGERCLELTKDLSSTHHVFLGERSAQEQEVLPEKKQADWKTEQVVLGWLVDTFR